MSREATVVRNQHTANPQRNAGLELVRVPAKADTRNPMGLRVEGQWFFYPPKLALRRFSCDRKNSANSKSAGVVIFILRGEPMTTCTAPPLRSISDASS